MFYHDKSTWLHFIPSTNFIPLSFYKAFHDKEPSWIFFFSPEEVPLKWERSSKKDSIIINMHHRTNAQFKKQPGLGST